MTTATETTAEAAGADRAPGEPSYPSLGAANFALVLLFVAYVLAFIDRQILSLLVGPIRAHFGISDFQYSLLAGAAFAIPYSLASLPFGRLADLYSRKVIVACSVTFWSLSTVATGTATGIASLFGARMGVGVGEAGLAPPAYSIITDSYRPRHFGYAMSFYKAGVRVGGGLALVVGGFLMDTYMRIGAIELPIVGTVEPWQATLITVGLPGVLIGLLALTMVEPQRKEMATSRRGDQRLPVVTLAKFLWRRRRVYLSLFCATAMLAMAGYGSGGWYPEMLVRNYGMSRGEVGSIYGMLVLTSGLLGIMMGPWIASRLSARGYTDAYVRTMLITTLITIVPSIAAPLAGSATLTLIILWPAMLFSGAYLGVMAAAFQPITPNQMRGQTTGLYIFFTSFIGMAFGTSTLAALTDFLYKDDGMLHYSIATTQGVFKPVAALLFWYCLAGYQKSMAEAGKWEVD